jgi:U3 small nucleolar RNA-associated protein 10
VRFTPNRYRINAYNESALLSCILPHHDTPLFARALQVFPAIAMPSHPWHWLNHYRQEGIPVPKSDLYRQCGRDLTLIGFIGNAVIATAKVRKKWNCSVLPPTTQFRTI